jgi:hypothetical protein
MLLFVAGPTYSLAEGVAVALFSSSWALKRKYLIPKYCNNIMGVKDFKIKNIPDN